MPFNPEHRSLGPLYGVRSHPAIRGEEIYQLINQPQLVGRRGAVSFIDENKDLRFHVTPEQAMTELRASFSLLTSLGITLPDHSFVYDSTHPFLKNGAPALFMVVGRIKGKKAETIAKWNLETKPRLAGFFHQLLNTQLALLDYLEIVQKEHTHLLYDIFTLRQFTYGFTATRPQTQLYLHDLDYQLIHATNRYYPAYWQNALNEVITNLRYLKQQVGAGSNHQSLVTLANQAMTKAELLEQQT